MSTPPSTTDTNTTRPAATTTTANTTTSSPSKTTSGGVLHNVKTCAFWFVKTYLGDIILLVPVSILWAMLQFRVKPRTRCIPGEPGCTFATSTARDPSLSYPWHEDSISASEQYAITAAVWLTPMFAGLFLNRRILSVRQHGPIFVTIVVQALAFAFLVNQCVGKGIKLLIGRPRPNYYFILQHNPKQARLSFPSGHSQLSNTMLLLLFFHLLTIVRYLQYKRDGWKMNVSMHPGDDRHTDFDPDHLPAGVFFADRFFMIILHYKLDTLAYFFAFLPVIVGEYIGLSRIIDYQHHVGDVLGGAVIGALLAFLSYNVYYSRIYGTLFVPAYERNNPHHPTYSTENKDAIELAARTS